MTNLHSAAVSITEGRKENITSRSAYVKWLDEKKTDRGTYELLINYLTSHRREQSKVDQIWGDSTVGVFTSYLYYQNIWNLAVSDSTRLNYVLYQINNEYYVEIKSTKYY